MSPEAFTTKEMPAELFVTLAGTQLPIVDALNDGIVAAADTRIVYANSAVERLLGWGADDLIGRLVAVLIPERLRADHVARFERYLRLGPSRVTGQPTRVPALCADGSERAVELVLSTLPLSTGGELVVATIRDAIVRVDFERQSTLAHNLLSVFANDAAESEIVDLILATLGESFAAAFVSLWLPALDGRHLHSVGLWHAAESSQSTFENLTRALELGFAEGLPGRVWRSGEAIWIRDLAEDINFPRRDVAVMQGLVSAFAFPVRAHTATVGVIELLFSEDREDDRTPFELMSAIGPQLGAFLKHKHVDGERQRIAQRERLAVTALQKSLLPPALPAISGLDLGVHFHPSSDDLVIGGDFYDVFPIRGAGNAETTSWGLLIGDVCGTGPEAAAITGLVRYTVRALAHMGLAPSEVLRHVNSTVLDRDAQDDRFCTAIFAVISETSRGQLLRITNAGHPPPLLRRSQGLSAAVETHGQLLGVLETISLPEVTIELSAGDLVLFHTDGITEARAGPEQFGETRLIGLLDDVGYASAGQIAEAVVRTAETFADTLSDDTVVLIIKATDRQAPTA